MMRSDQAQDNLWKDLIKPWEERTRNKVNFFSATNLAGEGYEDKLQAFYAAGTPPDVINMDWGRFAEFRAKGAFIDLKPLIQMDKFDIDDFFPNGQRVYEADGRIYGILRDIAPQVIFYNQKILHDANYPTPTDSWQWPQLLDAAIRLTKTSPGPKVFGYGPYAGWTAVAEYVVQNGGQLWDDLYNPTKLQIDSPEAIEAGQFWYDLLHKYQVIPTPADLNQPGIGWQPPLFAAGRIALVESSLWYIDAWKKLPFSWDVVLIPYAKKRATHAFSAGYSIPPKPKNLDASWSLLQHMASKQVNDEIAKGGWLMPGRKSAVADYFVKSTPPANKVAFLKQLEFDTVYGVPLSPRANEISDAINAEWDPLNRGQAQPKDVFPVIAKKVRDLLAKK